jgi:hypothetical protein
VLNQRTAEIPGATKRSHRSLPGTALRRQELAQIRIFYPITVDRGLKAKGINVYQIPMVIISMPVSATDFLACRADGRGNLLDEWAEVVYPLLYQMSVLYNPVEFDLGCQ